MGENQVETRRTLLDISYRLLLHLSPRKAEYKPENKPPCLTDQHSSATYIPPQKKLEQDTKAQFARCMDKLPSSDDFLREFKSGLDSIGKTLDDKNKYVKIFIEELRMRFKELGLDTNQQLKSRDCDLKKCKILFEAVKRIEQARSDGEFNGFLPYEINTLLRDISPSFQPHTLFSVALNNPQKTAVAVLTLDNFDPIPASAEGSLDPRKLKIATAFNESPELNLHLQLLQDDPATPKANEGMENLANYLEQKYFPEHPDILEKFSIKDLKRLTPKQALLLAAEVAVRSIEYSNTQVEGSSANRQRAENERKLNDSASSITALLSSEKSSDGNGVCRNYAPVTTGVFEALKTIQNKNASMIEQMYVLHNQLGCWESFPGHVQMHAWNEVLYIEPGENGRILACVIDSTWADSSSGRDPARAGNGISRGLDYTEARYLPMLERFFRQGLIDSEQFADKLLEQTQNQKISSELCQQAQSRLELLFPRLSSDKQKQICAACEKTGFRIPATVASTYKKPADYFLEKSISKQDMSRFCERLDLIYKEHPELLPPDLSLAVKRSPKSLFDSGELVLGIDWGNERIIQTLRNISELRREISSVQRETSAILDMQYAFPGNCNLSQSQQITRNVRDYFCSESRQTLFSGRTFSLRRDSGDRPVHTESYYSVFIEPELFAADYDPAKIDKKLSEALMAANSPEQRAAREETAGILRAVHSLEESPYIGGIMVDKGVKNAVALTAALKAELLRLPEETLQYLQKVPPNFQLTSSKTFLTPDIDQPFSLKEAARYDLQQLFSNGYLSDKLRVLKTFSLDEHFDIAAVDHLSVQRKGVAYPVTKGSAANTICLNVNGKPEKNLKPGDLIIPRKDPTVEVSRMFRRHENQGNLYAANWGCDPNIIIFSDDLVRDGAALQQALRDYLKTWQLIDSTKEMDIQLGYAGSDSHFLTPKDLEKLGDTVDFLKANKDKFTGLQQIKLDRRAYDDSFEIDRLSSTGMPDYSENQIKGEKGLLSSLDRIQGIYTGLRKLAELYGVSFSSESRIGADFADFLPNLAEFLASSDGKYKGSQIIFNPDAQEHALKNESHAEIHKYKAKNIPPYYDQKIPYYHFICTYPDKRIEINASPTSEQKLPDK